METTRAPTDPALSARRARIVLAASGVATLLLYAFGGILARPLVYLSTLVHELGHGVTALLVGGQFDKFQMWSDGSGLAHTFVARPWQAALVCAGGLVGPALAAAGGFALARRARWARLGLGAIGLFLVWAVVFKVRTAFGVVVALGVAGLTVATALRGGAEWSRMLLGFLSLQLALSVFSRSDYLFVRNAHVGGHEQLSDVGIMSEAIGGPFWGWGMLCGLLSVVILGFGAWMMLRRPRAARAPRVAAPPLS